MNNPLKPNYRPLWIATLFSFLILIIPIFFFWKDFNFDSSAQSLLAQDRRSEMSYDKMKEVLKENKLIFIAIDCDKVFDETNLKNIRDLCDTLLDVPGAFYINSISHTPKLSFENLQTADLMNPLNLVKKAKLVSFLPSDLKTKDIEENIRKEIMDFPLGPDLLLSRNHETILISLVVERRLPDAQSKIAFEKEINKQIEPFKNRFKEFKVFSFPFLENEMIDTVKSDTTIFIIIVIILIQIILFITFRSLNVILLVGLFEAMGLSAIAGIIVWQADGFNLYAIILIPLLAGLQLTFLSHLFSMWQRDWTLRQNMPDAVRDTLHHIFKPSFIAAVTTSVGLLSLMSSEVDKIQEFGRVGGISVITLFIISFLPFYLLYFYFHIRGFYRVSREKPSYTPSSQLNLEPFVNRLYKIKWILLILFISLGCIVIPAFSRMNTDVRALEFLDPEGKSRQTLQLINEKLGGINLFQLVVDCGKPGGIDQYKALEYMEKLRTYANSLEGVSSTYCYSSAYVYINQILYQINQTFHKENNIPIFFKKEGLPPPFIINMASGFVKHEHVPELEAMITPDKQKTYFIIRNQDMPSQDYLKILEKFQAFAKEHKPEGIKLEVEKGIHTLLKQDRDITHSQIKSLTWSLGIIFICLVILWFSPRLAMIAILCNVLPLLLIIGIIGYFGIALNSVTVMVAAVVFGIAVDDAIHFLSYFKSNMKKGLNSKEALVLSIQHKLKPMACTSAVMVSSLALFIFSSFPPIQNFGLLSATALAMAFASMIFFIPVFIALFYRDKIK